MLTAVGMTFLVLMVIASLLLGMLGLYAYSFKHRTWGWRVVLLLAALVDLVLIAAMVQGWLGTF